MTSGRRRATHHHACMSPCHLAMPPIQTWLLQTHQILEVGCSLGDAIGQCSSVVQPGIPAVSQLQYQSLWLAPWPSFWQQMMAVAVAVQLLTGVFVGGMAGIGWAGSHHLLLQIPSHGPSFLTGMLMLPMSTSTEKTEIVRHIK